MDIRKYLAAVERTYNYRIKTVVEVTDEVKDAIEQALLKYEPLDISSPKKTIFQKAPLDFPSLSNVEVYILDVELAFPASPYVMTEELRLAMGCPKSYVVVRGDNDPTELETERLNAESDMADEAKRRNLEPGALLTKDGYEEAEQVDASQFYGNEYNSRFLGILGKIEKERAESRRDPANALFKFLDHPPSDVADDNGAFNDHIEGAPQISPKASRAKTTDKISDHGNLDDDNKEHSRVFQKGGKTYVLKRKTDSVRKGK